MRTVGGVPVEPDAATARRWVREELLDPAYHQQESLLQRALSWVFDQLEDLPAIGMSGTAGLLVVVGVVVVVVLVALRVAGPVRAGARQRRAGVLHVDDRRTAAQLRDAADAAARAGAWSSAVADRFRAVVRDLEERGLLDERPGRTAHEAARVAGAALPAHAAALARGGDLFDDVVYGDREATRADDDVLRELDATVRAARLARADA
ncbi:DUF4129 domain-containing protein [Cellulomonas wangsupingiae]|uniref:DUF4129 domain-containing protein n=1 Tax=Cellulomonas wangsupingiae TaxID=2968085 RepID=A0ABY5K268_9CELL|nr:DUF4129 domain-containing protein [Cellulomonas wangsupingiae]MCC2335651.1 DUF4129 domain-containing protein [Cellulomonas wangsupingiae]MCM0640282.1 DUF4129 domain-containing protein [Cellulomonas wangsupingiae]UUI63888.1 DUF4129 domain-containing protein [Cellulomonas wangsupingiae]